MITLSMMHQRNKADLESSEHGRRWDGGWGMEKECTDGWHEDGGSGHFPSKAEYQSVSEWGTLKLEERLQEEKFGKEVAREKGEGTEKD